MGTNKAELVGQAGPIMNELQILYLAKYIYEGMLKTSYMHAHLMVRKTGEEER